MMFYMPGSEEPVFRFLTCHGLAFALSVARLGGKKYRSAARMIFSRPTKPVRAALRMTGQKAIFARKKLEYPFWGITVGRKLPLEIKNGVTADGYPRYHACMYRQYRYRARLQKTRKLRMHRMMASATRKQAIR